jgi:hypothetical protein
VARPSKSLDQLLREGGFRARRHAPLLHGSLVSPEGPRRLQVAFQQASETERRALALEFEQAAAEYAAEVRESPLEAIRVMGFPEFAEMYLRHPKGHWAGEPFVLESWQGEFDRERSRRDASSRLVHGTMFLGLPRGNGKTAYAAGVALHELLRREGEPDVFFAASSKRQAEIALGFVKGFVRGNKQLSDLLDVSKDSVLCPETEGTMTVLPAQGATAYGLAPAVAICDELHVWEKDAQRELWAALRTGAQKAKDGFVLVISTAPGSSSSLLAGLLDHELAKENVERPHDSLAIVRDEDAGVLTWWYGAPEDANIDDQELWQRCNPASFVTGRDLRRQRLAPGIDAATFAKLHLNRAGADPGDALIDRASWDACRDDTVPSVTRSSGWRSVLVPRFSSRCFASTAPTSSRYTRALRRRRTRTAACTGRSRVRGCSTMATRLSGGMCSVFAARGISTNGSTCTDASKSSGWTAGTRSRSPIRCFLTQTTRSCRRMTWPRSAGSPQPTPCKSCWSSTKKRRLGNRRTGGRIGARAGRPLPQGRHP